MSPEAKLDLARLLADLFDFRQLRALLECGPDGEAIVRELPDRHEPWRDVVAEGVEQLVRRGHVNVAFFARLRDERPERAAEIDRCSALCLTQSPEIAYPSTLPGNMPRVVVARRGHMLLAIGAPAFALGCLVCIGLGALRSPHTSPPDAPPAPAAVAPYAPPRPPPEPLHHVQVQTTCDLDSWRYPKKTERSLMALCEATRAACDPGPPPESQRSATISITCSPSRGWSITVNSMEPRAPVDPALLACILGKVKSTDAYHGLTAKVCTIRSAYYVYLNINRVR